jgi:hypothetical protein
VVETARLLVVLVLDVALAGLVGIAHPRRIVLVEATR